MKLLAVALAAVTVSAVASPTRRVQQSPDKLMAEDLYAAYQSSGRAVLAKVGGHDVPG